MMRDTSGVANFLTEHRKKKSISFHMPGHKGKGIYVKYGYEEFLENIMDCDITEIDGADNLFQTEGIILETMEKYKKLYNSVHSHLLINGSSAGLIAAILSCCEEGDSLLMARNCHKSIFNALNIGKINPVYIHPETIKEWGIAGEVRGEKIEELLQSNPTIKAVILPSPNYYGICSNIKEIAKVVHKYNSVLIVDQAHGAHLKFFDDYNAIRGNADFLCAENQDADIVINSTHKTLASFTQSAIVNIMSHRVDNETFLDKVQLIESTSPSYLLMASLDINADILLSHQDDLISSWISNVKDFIRKAKDIKGLKVMEVEGLDYTKINIDMSSLGIEGHTLEEELMKRKIFPELVTGNIVMLMTGIGNVGSDYDNLLEALGSISKENENGTPLGESNATVLNMKMELKEIPKNKEKVELSQSVGRVCGASLIPYPPGIPMVCPGERINKEVISYLLQWRNKGYKVIGVDSSQKILVGKE